jgi:hypothetical protein
MTDRADYYVYVYIDPRNFEEFYFGKGCGGRKDAHLSDVSDSAKVRRIAEIRREGEEPVVRVIAKGLTEREALLVEATLIWRSGKYLTNRVSGHYSSHFRPANRMHVKLPDFDFFNGVFYVNVSPGDHRSWNDCRKYGFIAAGNGRNWSEQLDKLNPGDVVAAYIKGRGFVGVGTVHARATRVRRFQVNGRKLRPGDLEQPRLFEYAGDPELDQYLVAIKWSKTVPEEQGKFRSNAGLYTPQRVVASLGDQPKTRKFIEDGFEVSLERLLRG